MIEAVETLEAQVETAWLQLLDCTGRRSYYLTAAGRLQHGTPPRAAEAIPVGTYTRSVSLAQFREDVFEAYGEVKAHARG